MADAVSGVAFIALSIALIGGAVGMLVTRNVMRAGFWLLELCLAAAALFFLLGADYLALIQLLVYAGAVSVIVIFSIMITMRRHKDAMRPRDFSWQAACAALIFAAIIIAVIVGTPIDVAEMPSEAPDLVAFSKILFSPEGWALPFEISSIILTVALVGAVWWSGKGEE